MEPVQTPSDCDHTAGTSRSLLMQRPITSRSSLESLPVEIIQKIFLECLEISLPRASLFIARSLSDPLIYAWLVRLAFSSANDSSRHGFFTPDFLPPPLDFFALSPEERSVLQTRLLQCRWCTVELMRRCQRDYVEHVIRRKCQQLIFSSQDREFLSNLDSYFLRRAQYDRGRNGRRGKGDIILNAKDPESQRDLKVAIWFNFGAVQIREPSPVFYETDMFRLPACSVDAPARMPDKLLHPPWTGAKLEFLSLLSLEAYIDEDSSCHRSKRVIRQAIHARDFNTFENLLGMYIRVKNYNYPLRWPARPSHFRAALKYARGPNDPFVRYLVQNRWHELPPHDIRTKNDLMVNLGMGEGS
ncbi:hypothetical protein DTO166G4_5172 [Paecilomyces variotii]|uniref:Uncharacterized protein n=1 Tax=Byssochlamys spectabilis TaxID=264951 RepID=A0A443HQM1_BYSSP|nr:hypothetical protein C8Q69DRAFT_315174 [Paecilomyces variotii]KAJ9192717.1 hypothetical protein DTO032I3_8179 [Paecilomyces variotii]KAJ9213179.1 hypothetical protein DTO166G4_5172 [Paecilomyces variotii]KAJ9218840.1 hypothetical protein DTO169C6_8810 [Paecilomyces variotii]KAJ9229638.1 hypothetical protein DTO169E5_8825 [Paecilomyces variotii]KAJ9235727.1 hypothetical protein DTO166G5_4471 [Paecilomyces variotii]